MGELDYGVMYNWDGAPFGYSPYPQSLEQFVDKVYAPLENTQVGALCWCMGTHEATWPSAVVEMVGDTVDRKYQSVREMTHVENIRAMYERGDDPHVAMVQRGHELGMAVYTSIRMNDNHFRDLVPEDLATAVRSNLTRLRKEHPEWVLGTEQAPRWASTSWNMAIPEVRQHMLALVTEACRLADWDGVELDWQRHAFHLPADDAYRLRYAVTDLQRAIRKMADEIGRQRGRPLRVAVRVATTLESCRRIGYDIETWAQEGLCDIVICGGNSGTDPGAEVEDFGALLKERGIKFYGGFDSDGRQQAKRLVTHGKWREAWFSAAAYEYYQRGADGIYVFNWHGNAATHRSLLSTMGAVDTLENKDKIYASLHRFIGPNNMGRAGADRDDRIYGETPVTLYPTLTGEGPIFHLPVYDAASAQAVELHIEMMHWAPDDEVAVKLDGAALAAPAVRSATAENSSDPAEVGENSWLVWDLAALQLGRGVHAVQIDLVRRNARINPALVVQHVEIHVNFSS